MYILASQAVNHLRLNYSSTHSPAYGVMSYLSGIGPAATVASLTHTPTAVTWD